MRTRIKRGSLIGFLFAVAIALNWTAVPAFTRIGRRQSMTIQVSNSDGVLSEPFRFTRPID